MDVKCKPSGYLKRKCEVENAAITAVKMQLGRHYQDNGPLLGIHFDPLPPGAFEPPIDETDVGSHYADDPTLTSPHGYGVQKLHNFDCRFSSCNSKVDYRRSYEEGNFGGEHSFRYYDHQMHNQSNKNYGSTNLPGEFGGRKSSDTPEYHNGDMYSSGRGSRSTTSGHPAEEMRQGFAFHCLPPISMKIYGIKKDCYVHGYGTVNNGSVQHEKMKFEHVPRHYSESASRGGGTFKEDPKEGEATSR